jgi:hypothetical protein
MDAPLLVPRVFPSRPEEGKQNVFKSTTPAAAPRPDRYCGESRPRVLDGECNGGDLTYAAHATPSGSWVLMTTVASQQTIDMWKSKDRMHRPGQL